MNSGELPNSLPVGFMAESLQFNELSRILDVIAEKANAALQSPLAKNAGFAQQGATGFWIGTPEEPGLYQQLLDTIAAVKRAATDTETFNTFLRWSAYAALFVAGAILVLGRAVAIAKLRDIAMALNKAREMLKHNLKRRGNELPTFGGPRLGTANGAAAPGGETLRKLLSSGRADMAGKKDPLEGLKKAAKEDEEKGNTFTRPGMPGKQDHGTGSKMTDADALDILRKAAEED